MTERKRPYQRPTIERVDLVGEEMAAVPNCKRDNGGGKSQSFPNPCRTTGAPGLKCLDQRGS